MAKQLKEIEEPAGDHFYRLFERLFKELDQEDIRKEVNILRSKHPTADRRALARMLTKSAALKSASVGAAAGLATGPFALLAMAPDIFNLVRQQSRLVLSIAFVFDQKPDLKERFREVLAVLAVSTTASAARRGVAWYLTQKFEQQAARTIVTKLAGKFSARAVPKMVPVVGSVVGAGINYASVAAIGKAAVEYYERTSEL